MPYNDEIFDDGVIEYEGHDVSVNINKDKKSVTNKCIHLQEHLQKMESF